MLLATYLLERSHQFIHDICDPDAFDGDFSGDLGEFTPCFIDIVCLGVGHVFAIILYLIWIYRITVSPKPDRFRPVGTARGFCYSCLVAAFAATAIPLFQLNARLAEQVLPLSQGAVAPHEWLELLLAIGSFALLCVILLLELRGHLVLRSRWMLRAPLLFVASSELVKLRFVLQLEWIREGPGRFGYFFWLYCVYVAAQVYLAIVLLLNNQDTTNLHLAKEGMISYMPLRNSTSENCTAATEQAKGICPEWTAGIFSKLTFQWLSPVVKLGYKTPLTQNDIWDLPPPDRVEAVEQRFRAEWERQLKSNGRGKASLFAACWYAVRGLFLSALPFKLINDGSQFVGPTVLKQLLSVVEAKAAASDAGNMAVAVGIQLPDWLMFLHDPLQNGYVLAGLLFLGTATGLLADNQHFQRVMRAGFRLKAVLASEVYRKVLVLPPSERAHLTSGKLFNLVSSDAQTVGDFCQSAFGFLSAPLRIGVTMVLLYKQLGPAAMVAIFCIAAAVPINSKLVKMAAARLQAALRQADTRAKLEAELVAGMEVVKASAWETPFYKRITTARVTELAGLYSVTLIQAVMGILVNAIPTVIPVVTFLAYLLIMKRPLSPAQAFTALSLFNILRFPLFQLPQIVTQATQARVALNRITDLLAASELPAATTAAATIAATAAAATNGDATPAGSGSGSNSSKEKSAAIRIHGDFTWDPTKPPTLTDLDLVIKSGTLVAVVGPTGSGKTSLISAMLGLLPPVSNDSQIKVQGRTTYVPQASFILGGTVRENVLFGREFEEDKYWAAVKAAQLLTDFAALPGGDQTELGDRGVNVSGGQKQRIAIARALYAGADVNFMDDPLSALDAKVGRAVANQAIKKSLASKTVVLATNQLQYVCMCDLVVVMRGGRAVEVGTYQDLLAAGGTFTALMKEAQAEDTMEELPEESLEGSLLGNSGQSGTNSTPANTAVSDAAAAQLPTQPDSSSSTAAAGTPAAQQGATSGIVPAAGNGMQIPTGIPQNPPGIGQNPAAGKLSSEETAATGGVSWAVVRAYLSALGGTPAVALLLATFLGTELLRVGSTVWLSIWTSQQQGGHDTSGRGSSFYMGIYAAISGGQLLLLLCNFITVATYGNRAGRVLHEKLLSSLLKAPMSFYHTTSTGRIINRLTKDTSDIDRNLASNLAFAFRAFLQLTSTVILIGAGAPFALPALVVILRLFWGLYNYFMASMRQAKRLEAVSRSPVLSSVSEAINGLATIRAFGISPWLINRYQGLVNRNAAVSLLTQSLNRWLSVRLEGLGALCTLLAAIVTVEQQGGNAATMGLLLTYALQITVATSMTLRAGSMAEQTFNAVERVDEYCHLPSEPSEGDPKALLNPNKAPDGGGGSGSGGGSSSSRSPFAAAAGALGPKAMRKSASSALREPLLPITESGHGGASRSAAARGAAAAAAPTAGGVPDSWPDRGSIEFCDVRMRYRPGLPLVLDGLSFKVDQGFKVGVVGRTGAGKSSLIAALFRLTEIESGVILIDDVNAKSVGLRRLRSSMALIPQVPVLFTGSIRENLSPFGAHSDSALWSALRRSHLAPVVEEWEAEGLGGLDYQLGEGGAPLSAGQKQLLALARALLNPAKILVLDEATANVDVETDALIQETLRAEFGDRTLLAVAHRLHTIIEADRVLVMDKGRALEYGAPGKLLENESGAFTGMVRETGEATEKFLRSMAAGDVAAQQELQQAAAVALVAVSLPCTAPEPANLGALAKNVAQNAVILNQQLNGLLRQLQAQMAADGDSLSAQLQADGGTFMQESDGGVAAGGTVVVPYDNGHAANAGGRTASGTAVIAMQQLKAALAATSQLQQVAANVQALLRPSTGRLSGGDTDDTTAASSDSISPLPSPVPTRRGTRGGGRLSAEWSDGRRQSTDPMTTGRLLSIRSFPGYTSGDLLSMWSQKQHASGEVAAIAAEVQAEDDTSAAGIVKGMSRSPSRSLQIRCPNLAQCEREQRVASRQLSTAPAAGNRE